MDVANSKAGPSQALGKVCTGLDVSGHFLVDAEIPFRAMARTLKECLYFSPSQSAMEEKSEVHSTELGRGLSLAWIALRMRTTKRRFPLPILPTRLNFG